jgi:NhaP-type Na+/H+ or K+/H+ antiporter
MQLWNPQTNAYEPLNLPWQQNMILCALLVSTDFIAAESFVDPNQQKPQIFELLQGQSLVNDAVSVILFTTVFNQVTRP